MKYTVIACLAILFMPKQCVAQSAGAPKLERSYICLRKLAQTVTQSGLDQKTSSQLKSVRQVFLEKPEDAASFLRLKLATINATEMKYFSGTRRFEDIIKYLDEQKSASQLKTYTIFVLAELYPHVSRNTQREILAALEHSFTPIFSLNEDLLSLQWSLWYIGPDSVPTLLEVSKTPEKVIRCNVQDGLNSLAAEIGEGAPVLACEDEAQVSEEKISKWQQWWLETGAKRPFRRVPSPFEAVEQSSSSRKP